MINILSINCSLAFAPYLLESVSSFLDEGREVSRVVHQGGSGLIIRSEGEIKLRYRNRETAIGGKDMDHYRASIGFRSEFYDVLKMPSEVVIASVADSLLLSHSQSELWLDAETISRLIEDFRNEAIAEDEARRLPEWLSLSPGGGQLLLSDQRSGRWVLLGSDHIEEFERRMPMLESSNEPARSSSPPTLSLKGITIHLQSAARLARTLETFAETQQVEPFEETAPEFRLVVSRGSQGLEISDSSNRAGITVREARKWAAIISNELAQLNVSELTRGRMKTVFADGGDGRWVLQWGDEVLVPDDMISRLPSIKGYDGESSPGWPIVKRDGELLLLLSQSDSSCVALTSDEEEYLIRAV